MKKRYLFLATLALAGLATVPLCACDLSGIGSSTGANGDHKTEATTVGTYTGIGSTESVYGVGAVTSAELLAETLQSSAPAATAEAAPQDPAQPQDQAAQPDYGLPENGGANIGDVQNAAEDFNTYFNMLDSFLDKGATKTVVEKNVSEDPMLSGYALKLTITGRNAAGEENVHTVYYTETAGKESTNTFRDDDEVTTVTEMTYTLEGAVRMGKDAAGSDVYYFMTGTRTERTVTETEGREEETEQESILKMTAFASELDMSNRVELSNIQTTESESEGFGTETETESLYTYSVYAGGKLTESTQVEFETEEEHGETETEYTVRFLNGASRGTYEIERETRAGNTWITVEYNIDGKRGKFVIVEDNGAYNYKFSQNSADDRSFANFGFDD